MTTDRARIRVFVSSTWLDLQPEREAVEKILHRMRTVEYPCPQFPFFLLE